MSLFQVEVNQHVYSTAEGSTGNWSYRITMNLPVVPAAGDELVHGWDGRHSEVECSTVKRRYIYQYGQVAIELNPVQTDSPQIVAELEELRRNWQKLGGPWAGQ